MQLSPDEITRLSPQERLSLIEQLWESLSPTDIPLTLTPAHQAELERRLATFDHDRAQGVTWDSLKAELARRCP
jgi:putative addiction module component (TIGR02574 family)